MIDNIHLAYWNRTTFRHRFMKNTGAVGGGDLGGGSAAATTGTTSAGTGTSSTSTPSTPSSGVAATSGSQPGDTTGTTGDVDGIKDGDFRNLRTKYQEVKGRAAVLDTLGIPVDKLPTAAKQWNAIYTEVGSLAKELGYDDPADVEAAFANDPIGLINLLRKEKSEAEAARTSPQRTNETDAQYSQRIADEVKRQVELQTKPFTEQVNKQMSDAVTAKIGTEFNTAYNLALPNTPPEVRSLVEDYVIEHIQSSPDHITNMKYKGDYSAVDETVKFVAGRLKGVFQAWVKAETARTGQGSRGTTDGGQQGTGTKRPTLDEMIADPSLINPKYAE